VLHGLSCKESPVATLVFKIFPFFSRRPLGLLIPPNWDPQLFGQVFNVFFIELLFAPYVFCRSTPSHVLFFAVMPFSFLLSVDLLPPWWTSRFFSMRLRRSVIYPFSTPLSASLSSFFLVNFIHPFPDLSLFFPVSLPFSVGPPSLPPGKPLTVYYRSVDDVSSFLLMLLLTLMCRRPCFLIDVKKTVRSF